MRWRLFWRTEAVWAAVLAFGFPRAAGKCTDSTAAHEIARGRSRGCLNVLVRGAQDFDISGARIWRVIAAPRRFVWKATFRTGLAPRKQRCRPPRRTRRFAGSRLACGHPKGLALTRRGASRPSVKACRARLFADKPSEAKGRGFTLGATSAMCLLLSTRNDEGPLRRGVADYSADRLHALA